MKFKYVPGLRPTPMLMYYTTINEEVFNDDEKNFHKGNFTDSKNHIWNMGAYLIYNDLLEVIAYRIASVENFLWLLRVLNKEMTIDFEQDFVEKNQNFIKELSTELISM